jgi:hypothetical protein
MAGPERGQHAGGGAGMTKPTTHTVHDGQTASLRALLTDLPYGPLARRSRCPARNSRPRAARRGDQPTMKEGLIPMSDRVVPGAREALPNEVRAAMLAAGKESWADIYPRRGDEDKTSTCPRNLHWHAV